MMNQLNNILRRGYNIIKIQHLGCIEFLLWVQALLDLQLQDY